MTYLTHTLGGVASGLEMIALAGLTDEVSVAAIMTGATLGSLLPDIDHTQSKISRESALTRAVSKVTTLFCSHRGVVHTPLFICIAFIVLKVIISLTINSTHMAIANWGLAGLAIGMLSHLVLDTLNPGGIMWLFPVSKKRFNLAMITTGSIGEKLFCALLTVSIVYFAGEALQIDLSTFQ